MFQTETAGILYIELSQEVESLRQGVCNIFQGVQVFCITKNHFSGGLSFFQAEFKKKCHTKIYQGGFRASSLVPDYF